MGEYFIYMHTNKENGKKYIGITSQSPKRRWQNGAGYSTQPYFYRAILKYGWFGFRHDILFQNLEKEEAETKERELISLYETQDPEKGYNFTSGGEDCKKMSEEAKRKISMARKGIPRSDETKIKIGAGNKGKKRSEEYIKRLSESQKGKKLSKETRLKISASKKGEKHPFYGKKRPRELVERIAKMSCRPVLQYALDGVFISEYESLKAAALVVGASSSGISSCCRKRTKSSAGYVWKYK